VCKCAVSKRNYLQVCACRVYANSGAGMPLVVGRECLNGGFEALRVLTSGIDAFVSWPLKSQYAIIIPSRFVCTTIFRKRKERSLRSDTGATSPSPRDKYSGYKSRTSRLLYFQFDRKRLLELFCVVSKRLKILKIFSRKPCFYPFYKSFIKVRVFISHGLNNHKNGNE